MRELLLITVDGRQYGIWKDEVLSVRDLPSLHRIPLSPACIAGMSIIDDKTVLLADLPVCIGHAPVEGNGSGRVLLMSVREKVAGFIVSGEIGSLSVPSNMVFAVPAYLATPVVDTCAVHDGTPVPIVNMVALSGRMLESGDPPAAGLEISGTRFQDASALARVRMITLGNELYAVSAADIEENSVMPGPIAGLAYVPRYVKGITYSRGRILPVIDLSQRMVRRKAAEGARMLIAGVGASEFGLLVDDDKETVEAKDLTIKTLPPIAQSSWLRSALVRAGEIVPFLDLVELLSSHSEGADPNTPGPRCTPDSAFPALFGRAEVDVVEFSLLGVRHALPKEEVEDIIDFKPCRAVPGAPQIVIGVAVHNGELLPVLDLEAVFGRRSLAAPAWRMMLVKNGDFRALVICEVVFGERRLPLDIQRAVPIILPHRVVYGCYLDEDVVRLIINVEAVAAHLEKSLAQELLPSLSREMREAPSKIISSSLGEEAEAPFQVETAMAAPALEARPFAAAAAPTELAEAGTGAISVDEDAQKLQEVHETGHDEVKQPTDETVRTVAGPESGEAAFAHAQEPEHAAETQEAEESSARMTEGAAGAAETGSVREDVGNTDNEPADVRSSAEESAPSGPGSEDAVVGQALPAPEQKVEDPSGEERTVEDRAGDEQMPMEPPTLTQRTQEPTVSDTAFPASTGREAVQAISEVTSAADGETREPDQTHTIYTEPASPLSDHQPVVTAREERAQAGAQPVSDHAWGRRLVYGTIGAVLVAAFYFFVSIQKPDAVRQGKEPIPATLEQRRAENITPPRPVERQETPLVLEVPADRPMDIEVYLVVEGDTLWSISKRFTGNPLNYPRIAGENRIADPDLIFPGQKILLKK
jgi:chemotaxis signal transduction protein/nucleoid-associated protein YgaU